MKEKQVKNSYTRNEVNSLLYGALEEGYNFGYKEGLADREKLPKKELRKRLKSI